MKVFWLATSPFLLFTVVFLVWVVSPLKMVFTGNKMVDIEGTWIDKWIEKVFSK